jgi:hypothetical protein
LVTEIVIDNHPHARSYTRYGGACDIKEHDWVHSNVVFQASPITYQPIMEAFRTSEPFKLLAWNPVIDCPTKTITRWYMQESPVPLHEGEALWLSFESINKPPFSFLQYLCDKYHIPIEVNSIYPYQIYQKRIHLQPFVNSQPFVSQPVRN